MFVPDAMSFVLSDSPRCAMIIRNKQICLTLGRLRLRLLKADIQEMEDFMDTEYGYSYGYSRNPMATAAVVLGVISLMTCLVFYISIPCGALAALFAILSRSKNPMPGKSRFGLVCGLFGMGLSVALTLASVWMVLTNGQMRAYLERYLQYYLGDSSFDLDSELETMFPSLKRFFEDDAQQELIPGDGSDSLDNGLFRSDDADDKEHENNAAGNQSPDDTPAAPSRQLPEGEGDFI